MHQPRNSRRGRNWENALEGLCVAGVLYAYAAYLRVRNAGRKLLAVARTPVEIVRLIRRLKRSAKIKNKGSTGGVVDVYEVRGCAKPGRGRRNRKGNLFRNHKIASYPLRNL